MSCRIWLQLPDTSHTSQRDDPNGWSCSGGKLYLNNHHFFFYHFLSLRLRNIHHTEIILIPVHVNNVSSLSATSTAHILVWLSSFLCSFPGWLTQFVGPLTPLSLGMLPIFSFLQYLLSLMQSNFTATNIILNGRSIKFEYEFLFAN